MTTGDATLEKSAGKTTKDDSLLSKTVETSLVDEESQRRLNNGSHIDYLAYICIMIFIYRSINILLMLVS